MSSPIHFVRRHLISAFVSLACLFGLAMSGSATGSMVITGKQIQDDSIPTRGATRTPRSSGSTTPTLLPVLGPPRPPPPPLACSTFGRRRLRATSPRRAADCAEGRWTDLTAPTTASSRFASKQAPPEAWRSATCGPSRRRSLGPPTTPAAGPVHGRSTGDHEQTGRSKAQGQSFRGSHSRSPTTAQHLQAALVILTVVPPPLGHGRACRSAEISASEPEV